MIVGKAPANTTRVELYWEVDPNAGSETTPQGPLVSGIDADGQFRVLMEPVRPDHRFLFRVVFERRPTASAALLFRTAAEAILRREIAGTEAAGLDTARAALVSEALVQAYLQALNEGQALSAARGETQLVAGGLLGTQEDAKAPAAELRRLAEPWFQADAERGAALERYRETASSLQRELAAIAGSASLARLLETLEAQPDSDPRNPRSGLFLPPGSRRLVGASAPEIAGRAEGRSASQPALALREAPTAEDADAFRERYRQTAEDLRRLREWLPAAMAGRALPAEDAGRLAELASGGGALRRAEQWAETQQAYAHEVQSALATRERALARWAGESRGPGAGDEAPPKRAHRAGNQPCADLRLSGPRRPVPPRAGPRQPARGGQRLPGPVNKKAPLRSQSLRQRLALTFGLTVTNIKLDDGCATKTCWERSRTFCRARLPSDALAAARGRLAVLPRKRQEPARSRPVARDHAVPLGVV